MKKRLPMHLSPRCGAHSRRTGKPCRNGAMKNGRCRLHGGKATGAPRGNRNAWKHGNDSARARVGGAAITPRRRRGGRGGGGRRPPCCLSPLGGPAASALR